MTTKPGEVYRVDLGAGGKVRLMLVVSREDRDAPLTQKSYANAQGLQAIQHHELRGPVGRVYGAPLEQIRQALRYALEL